MLLSSSNHLQRREKEFCLPLDISYFVTETLVELRFGISLQNKEISVCPTDYGSFSDLSLNYLVNGIKMYK